MSEPTYHYQPGQGWVPSVERRELVSLGDGNKVWFVARHPDPGERFLSKNYKWDPAAGSANSPNFEHILQNCWQRCYDDFSCRYSTEFRDDTYVYVTVLPYDS